MRLINNRIGYSGTGRGAEIVSEIFHRGGQLIATLPGSREHCGQTRHVGRRDHGTLVEIPRLVTLTLWRSGTCLPQSAPSRGRNPGPHLNRGSLGSRESSQPKRRLDRFIRFCSAH